MSDPLTPIRRIAHAEGLCSEDTTQYAGTLTVAEALSAMAEVERLQARERALAAALREVVESAHTDADRCPICGEELHAHASGCSIAAALAAVSAEGSEA